MLQEVSHNCAFCKSSENVFELVANHWCCEACFALSKDFFMHICHNCGKTYTLNKRHTIAMIKKDIKTRHQVRAYYIQHAEEQRVDILKDCEECWGIGEQ